jgi:hypothetical protein
MTYAGRKVSFKVGAQLSPELYQKCMVYIGAWMSSNGRRYTMNKLIEDTLEQHLKRIEKITRMTIE